MKFLDENKVLFFKLDENAVVPSKRITDAGYDVYSCFDEDYVVLEPMKVVKIPTKIASVMADRYAFILKERSSVGSKNIKIDAGVIDSSYRGEWNVVLTNLNDFPVVIAKAFVPNERLIEELKTRNFLRLSYENAITQALLVEVPRVEIIEVDEKEFNKYTSERGAKGFGSTDKKEVIK